MSNLGKEVKITTGLDFLAAAAAADRTGAVLDMQGWDGVLMLFKFADIAAGAATSVKAQQDTDPAGATLADLAGTGIAVADDDDDQIFVIDLYRPRERYVAGVVDKDAANNTNECLIYIQYKGVKAPFDNNQADAVTYELHVSPAEGVA